MTAAKRYVLTAAIKTAASGRETEILPALGIPWNGSASHIRCPYPDHSDEHPSWRWDENKRRAYCTCARSDSIFDVVAKVKGIDFEDAKIAVAEMIGRSDLIRHRGKRAKRGEGVRSPHDNTATVQQSGGCTAAAYAAAKKLPPEFLLELGLGDVFYVHSPALKIPYYDASGAEVAVRFRIGLDGNDKFRWRRGDKPALYGLNRVGEAAGAITIVEGESDCHTLWYAGFPAIGLPGAGSWREERDAALFNNFGAIYVVIEPDNGGEAVRAWLAKSKIRERVKLVWLDGFKDASALYLDNPGRFAERWKAALAAAVPCKLTARRRPRVRPRRMYAESSQASLTFCRECWRLYMYAGSSGRNARSS
jgi:hypothetical protein